MAGYACRLRFFPYSLKDKAKAWLISFEPNSMDSWDKIAEKFLTMYFPPMKNARMRYEIISFEAWERFKEVLIKCPHHGMPIYIQMKTFYNGLVP